MATLFRRPGDEGRLNAAAVRDEQASKYMEEFRLYEKAAREDKRELWQERMWFANR
jgi:hypothetical protein